MQENFKLLHSRKAVVCTHFGRKYQVIPPCKYGIQKSQLWNSGVVTVEFKSCNYGIQKL